MQADCVCTVTIPVTVLCYQARARREDYGLASVFYSSASVDISNCLIKRRAMDFDTFNDITFFDKIHISEVNRKSVMFLLVEEDGRKTLCRPSEHAGGHFLEKLAVHPQWDLLANPTNPIVIPKTAEPSLSILSMIHHYQEVGGGLFEHQSVSVFPCASIFVPTCLSTQSMEFFLADWHTNKLKIARNTSMLTISTQDSKVVLKTLYPSVMNKPSTSVFT